MFDCWYLEDDADMKEVNSSYKVDSKLKLKAKWNSVTKSDYDNSGFDGFDNVKLIDNSDTKIDLKKVSNSLIQNCPYSKNTKYYNENTSQNEIEIFNEYVNDIEYVMQKNKIDVIISKINVIMNLKEKYYIY